MSTEHINLESHPIADVGYIASCRSALDSDGALVLDGFFTIAAIDEIVAASAPKEASAFYADSTHNVYLTPPDPEFADGHPRNRQIVSSKGLIADDQIPSDSPLRSVYDDADFRSLLCGVLGIPSIHPYDDNLSSVNVHFASAGRELGWHFDNSSFAVTMLLQAPKEGGRFEYVPDVRNADLDEMGFDTVTRILDGTIRPSVLEFAPGALVLFRGRNSMHRVTPSKGPATRLLAVFAYNSEPGVRLSDSALTTFFGRTS